MSNGLAFEQPSSSSAAHSLKVSQGHFNSARLARDAALLAFAGYAFESPARTNQLAGNANHNAAARTAVFTKLARQVTRYPHCCYRFLRARAHTTTNHLAPRWLLQGRGRR